MSSRTRARPPLELLVDVGNAGNEGEMIDVNEQGEKLGGMVGLVVLRILGRNQQT